MRTPGPERAGILPWLRPDGPFLPERKMKRIFWRHAVCVGPPLFSQPSPLARPPQWSPVEPGSRTPRAPGSPPAPYPDLGHYSSPTGSAQSGGRASRKLVWTEVPARPSHSGDQSQDSTEPSCCLPVGLALARQDTPFTEATGTPQRPPKSAAVHCRPRPPAGTSKPVTTSPGGAHSWPAGEPCWRRAPQHSPSYKGHRGLGSPALQGAPPTSGCSALPRGSPFSLNLDLVSGLLILPSEDLPGAGGSPAPPSLGLRQALCLLDPREQRKGDGPNPRKGCVCPAAAVLGEWTGPSLGQAWREPGAGQSPSPRSCLPQSLASCAKGEKGPRDPPQFHERRGLPQLCIPGAPRSEGPWSLQPQPGLSHREPSPGSGSLAPVS